MPISLRWAADCDSSSKNAASPSPSRLRYRYPSQSQRSVAHAMAVGFMIIDLPLRETDPQRTVSDRREANRCGQTFRTRCGNNLSVNRVSPAFSTSSQSGST